MWRDDTLYTTVIFSLETRLVLVLRTAFYISLNIESPEDILVVATLIIIQLGHIISPVCSVYVVWAQKRWPIFCVCAKKMRSFNSGKKRAHDTVFATVEIRYTSKGQKLSIVIPLVQYCSVLKDPVRVLAP